MDNELLVDTPNPGALDLILQQFGGCLVGGPDNFVKVNDHYVIRVLGDVDYVKFSCERQGYCDVIDGPGTWTNI